MPYKSKAQQRKFHVLLQQGKISPRVVQEFDEATKNRPGGYKKLPEYVKKKNQRNLSRNIRTKKRPRKKPTPDSMP